MRFPLAAAIAFVCFLAGCVAPSTRPAQRPPDPRVAAAPVVPPQQAPLVQPGEDWRDVPLTAGVWRYVAAARTSIFGFPATDLFSVRCDADRRMVLLARVGSGAGPILIQTSAGSRSFPATAAGGRVSVELRATDPFLDAIAFSRGRFVVTSPPDPRLVVPAWPEVARVFEDCRG